MVVNIWLLCQCVFGLVSLCIFSLLVKYLQLSHCCHLWLQHKTKQQTRIISLSRNSIKAAPTSIFYPLNVLLHSHT